MYLLLSLIILCSSLYSMEKLYHSENVIKYSKIIDIAEKQNDKKLMSQLIHACLPQEVIQKYISLYFIKPIIKMYSHEYLTLKSFNQNIIIYNDTCDFVTQHDGKYYVAPRINQGYAIWQDPYQKHNEYQGHEIICGEKQYFTQLVTCQKKEFNFKLAVLNTNNPNKKNRKYILEKESKNNKESLCLTITKPVSECLFSSDNTLIAFKISENTNLNSLLIYDITTRKNLQLSIYGSIDTLCSAHHSPMFAIANNLELYIFSNKKLERTYYATRLDNGNSSITHLEFSPDDKKLLVCLYDKQHNSSTIICYDTTYPDKLKYMYGYTYQNSHIHKAFFICDGEKIIIMTKDGQFGLFEPSNNQMFTSSNSSANQKKIPLMIWSNKYDLIISALDKTIDLYSATINCKLKTINTSDPIDGIGLTIDETTIIFIDDKKSVYEIPIYTPQERNEINFIEKQMNIINLYELFTICKNKKNFLNDLTFFNSIQSYVQKIIKGTHPDES